MTSSNYQINAVDLDSTYIPGNDPNYAGIQSAVTNRKTVVFGQQLLTQTYPIGNLNGAINYVQSLPGTQTDQDSTTITGVGPTAVFYKNRLNTSQSLIRGSFNLLENTPQTNTWQFSGVNQTTPTLQAYSNWTQLANGAANTFALGIQSPGSLWAWGYNNYGQLGLSDTRNRSRPTQIGTLSSWTKTAVGGYFSLAIQSNGTLWSCGYNGYGQLGQGNTTNKSSLVQIGALSTWIQIAGGGQTAAAIQTPGTLWTWGYGGYGQLGNNSTNTVSSPIQIGATSTWTKISCGYGHILAIQSNGTLWGWGNNVYGQIGNSTGVSTSTPVQIGNLSTWTQITGGFYFSMAIQSNGTLWSCGYNNYGQLGINSNSPSIYAYSFIQVGSLSAWTQVSAGNNYWLALQSNGTLWACGYNGYGQLGQGNLTNYSSPIQVGILSGWSIIAAFNNQALSSLTNGSLYAWGGNSYGQLGLSPIGISVTKQTYGL